MVDDYSFCFGGLCTDFHFLVAATKVLPTIVSLAELATRFKEKDVPILVAGSSWVAVRKRMGTYSSPFREMQTSFFGKSRLLEGSTQTNTPLRGLISPPVAYLLGPLSLQVSSRKCYCCLYILRDCYAACPGFPWTTA